MPRPDTLPPTCRGLSSEYEWGRQVNFAIGEAEMALSLPLEPPVPVLQRLDMVLRRAWETGGLAEESYQYLHGLRARLRKSKVSQDDAASTTSTA